VNYTVTDPSLLYVIRWFLPVISASRQPVYSLYANLLRKCKTGIWTSSSVSTWHAPWCSGRPEISEPRSSDATGIIGHISRLYSTRWQAVSQWPFKRTVSVYTRSLAWRHTSTHTDNSSQSNRSPTSLSPPLNPTTRTKQKDPSTLIRPHLACRNHHRLSSPSSSPPV
jgi:hypothetical protein